MDDMTSESIKKNVRENYGSIAKGETKGCCGPSSCCRPDTGEQVRANKFLSTNAFDPDSIAEKLGYTDAELSLLPDEANLGLGCGNPTAIAALRPGNIVLDLGSGAGMDCFLAAAKVGAAGKVIGVDMTPEMIDKANENLRSSEFTNIEFRHGEIESLPVDDNSVDVVISNCVLNLVPDKVKAFKEIFRVLKPGGGMAVSDIVKMKKLPDAVQNDPDALSACIAGASMHDEYLSAISKAGLSDIRVLSEQDFGEMFFTMGGPEGDKLKGAFENGDASGYIASIKV
ncbi:MAG TPA: arsenite methyltransferase, partial [bacterium]|nr:arsenite methyltransferase [bacterium]